MELPLSIASALIPILLIGALLFLWVAMLIHAIRNNIPSKAVWILILLLTSVLGAIIYFFAVYKDQAKVNPKGKPYKLAGFIIMGLVFAGLIATTAIPQPPPLKKASLSYVVRQANSGQIKRIEISGDELKITKYGETHPTISSRKESGSSLYQQGLHQNAPVDIVVKSN